MNRDTKKINFRYFLILLLAELILIPSIASYLLNSQALATDTPGHMAEALVYRDNILPNIYGWNSFFFFGYPIHSYPPLSRIIIGAFSYLFGIQWATKIVLAISCLLIPATVYYFMLKHTENKNVAAFSALALAIFMLFVKNASFLVSLYGAFTMGLVANYVALPLFFLALAFYPKNWKTAIILSALVILTNMAVAMGLFLVIALIEILNWSKNKKFEFKRLVIYGLTVIALVAFWLAPFIINQSDTHVVSPSQQFGIDNSNLYFFKILPIYLSLTVVLVILLVLCKKTENKDRETAWFLSSAFALLLILEMIYSITLISTTADSGLLGLLFFAYPFSALFLLLKKKEWVLFIQLGILAILMISIIGLSLIYYLSPNGAPFLSLSIHVFRLQQFENIFEILVVGTALAYLIESIKSKTLFTVIGVLALSFLAAMNFGLIAPYAHPVEYAEDYDFSNANLTGRAQIFEWTNESIPQAAQVSYFLATKKPIGGGLFLEEAQLSVMDMDYLCDTVTKAIGTWGAFTCNTSMNVRLNKSENIRFYSRVLWISDVLLNENSLTQENMTFPVKDFENPVNFTSNGKTFLDYQVSNSEVVETIDPKPICENQWASFIKKWFQSGEIALYYQDCDAVWNGTGKFLNDDVISDINYSNGKISFNFNSDKLTPVMIKEAYSKGWNAYANGQKLQIYQVTPEFMLVFLQGNEKVEFRYEMGIPEYIGIAISLVTLAMLVGPALLNGRASARAKHPKPS